MTVTSKSGTAALEGVTRKRSDAPREGKRFCQMRRGGAKLATG